MTDLWVILDLPFPEELLFYISESPKHGRRTGTSPSVFLKHINYSIPLRSMVIHVAIGTLGILGWRASLMSPWWKSATPPSLPVHSLWSPANGYTCVCWVIGGGFLRWDLTMYSCLTWILCSPGWPQACNDLSYFSCWVVGLQMSTTIPGYGGRFFFCCSYSRILKLFRNRVDPTTGHVSSSQPLRLQWRWSCYCHSCLR